MTDDKHPHEPEQPVPEPLPEEIDPIGPGQTVPDPETPPEEWEEDDDLEGVDPEMPDNTETDR